MSVQEEVSKVLKDRRLRAFICACLGGATVLAVWTLGTAVAQADWITYPLPPGVNPALTTQQTVQGDRLGSACEFTFSGTLAPGSAGVEGDEVAFNPTTCQALYDVGPIQDSNATTDATNSSTDESSGSLGGGTSCCATTAAYLKTYWEDPVGIDVTSLRNDVEWNWHYGVCDNWMKWKRRATWYSPSGWVLNWVGDNPSIVCDQARSISHAQMENAPFCFTISGGPPTYTTYYYNHEIWGDPYGIAHYTYHDVVSGGCTSLLSHHYSAAYETPW